MTTFPAEAGVNRVSLVELDSGSSGVVVAVAGGRGATSRLEAMGIRPGVRLTKMSGLALKGPLKVYPFADIAVAKSCF